MKGSFPEFLNYCDLKYVMYTVSPVYPYPRPLLLRMAKSWININIKISPNKNSSYANKYKKKLTFLFCKLVQKTWFTNSHISYDYILKYIRIIVWSCRHFGYLEKETPQLYICSRFYCFSLPSLSSQNDKSKNDNKRLPYDKIYLIFHKLTTRLLKYDN